MADPESFDRIQPQPIRHESLTGDVQAKAKIVIDTLGRYLGTTLEQFEVRLMRETHPERKVAVWCAITCAWDDYHAQYLEYVLQSDEAEKELIEALILISTGEVDLQRLKVTEEVGQRLLACYRAVWQ